MSRRTAFYLAISACFLVISVPALAAKGGNGGGKSTPQPLASCSVDGDVVTGTGLPTNQVLNFMVTSAAETTGWVLGFSDTGTWPVTVPDPTGSTTYEFASKTWGPNGTKYDVFASCSTP